MEGARMLGSPGSQPAVNEGDEKGMETQEPSHAGRWVWVVTEQDGDRWADVTLEMLADARSVSEALGQPLLAVGLGLALPADRRLPERLGEHGADQVVWLCDPLLGGPEGENSPSRFPFLANPLVLAAGPCAAALTVLAEIKPPSVVVFAATRGGGTVAPALAVNLNAAFIAECLRFGVDSGQVIWAEKPLYGDKVHATVRASLDFPVVITLRPGVAGIGSPRHGRTTPVEVINAQLAPRSLSVEILRLIPADSHHVDLEQADRIVAAGRGVGGPEGISLLQRLADQLNAALGASRPPVDAGWLAHDRQIGQTGRLVSPELYLACGISGATAHLMGIRKARTVVAINTDRKAPIFEVADLGLVGDLHQIIPLLLDRLGEVKGDSWNSPARPSSEYPDKSDHYRAPDPSH